MELYMKKGRNEPQFFLPFFACLLLVFSLSAQTKESWLRLERNGKGYGYDHIIVEDLENGQVKYRIHQTIKTDIAGYNPQDIVQEGYYIVDENLEPVAFDLDIKFKTRHTRIQGETRDGFLFLTEQTDGKKIENQKIPFEDVFFDVVLGHLIYQRRERGNFVLKIFNPVEAKINHYQVEVIPDAKKGIIARVRERITMIFTIDRDGLVKQIKFVELNSRSYPTTASAARDIDYLNTADGLTLTVPVNPSFPDIWDINRAQFSVKWKGIPFEEFNFEDNRQRAIEEVKKGDEYEAVLEIHKPMLPSKNTSYPLVESEFSPCLEDTEYIKPHDPSIQKQLAEIKGNEKDALVLVRKILLWIYENIEPEYSVETLSGPEVLQRKRGKCVEFSTLFASMARAAGIPTRIAFGEALNGNNWVGHMWCEVWLGEWTAVDAAAGIIVESPSHLKFIHSPTVLGTQKIRWKLVDNLAIQILTFQR
jgi:hypothetical protein